ncbi:hypothetical protein [Sporosarcina sp. A2]|uniref:hypothetical protein n=1 Tax=Sporosarcina sp. A2 TaxID=3393449 RepID=UPI003D792111
MNKLVLVGALSILLAGCANNESAQEQEAPDNTTSSLEENSENIAPEDNNEAEEEASDPASQDNELDSYEEYSTIVDVADVNGLKGVVETDNPGTRVILFEDETGKKTVKSIFIKNENRLKVISLDNDGMLYNEILK